MKKLNNQELSMIKVGAGITLTSVMAILVTAIVAIIVYKLFMSSKGSTSLPGGFKFNWN